MDCPSFGCCCVLVSSEVPEALLVSWLLCVTTKSLNTVTDKDSRILLISDPRQIGSQISTLAVRGPKNCKNDNRPLDNGTPFETPKMSSSTSLQIPETFRRVDMKHISTSAPFPSTLPNTKKDCNSLTDNNPFANTGSVLLRLHEIQNFHTAYHLITAFLPISVFFSNTKPATKHRPSLYSDVKNLTQQSHLQPHDQPQRIDDSQSLPFGTPADFNSSLDSQRNMSADGTVGVSTASNYQWRSSKPTTSIKSFAILSLLKNATQTARFDPANTSENCNANLASHEVSMSDQQHTTASNNVTYTTRTLSTDFDSADSSHPLGESRAPPLLLVVEHAKYFSSIPEYETVSESDLGSWGFLDGNHLTEDSLTLSLLPFSGKLRRNRRNGKACNNKKLMISESGEFQKDPNASRSLLSFGSLQLLYDRVYLLRIFNP